MAEKREGRSLKQLIKENYVSGITVALVSLPLSTALAIAAGAPPMAGISAGIYGPLMGGLLGGSNYNILGPAGALVNNLNKLSTLNGPEIIPLVAALSGVFSLLVYLLKLDKYCTLIPISVLEGFSFGVAITIGFGQFNSAFGLEGLKKHPEFYNNVLETFSNLADLDPVQFVPFLCLYLTLMLLMKFVPGRPWIIFIALVGIIYGYLTSVLIPNIKPKLLKDAYPAMQQPSVINFSYTNNNIPLMNVIIGAAEVSFVAVLETLISARIADNLTGTRFDQHQEVFGMSLGNILSGLLGGTPCTGVLVRTGVNVTAGATDKISQLINAVTVLVITLLFMPAFVYMPLPGIAAILIVSATRLIPIGVLTHLYTVDIAEFIILLLTTAICVLVDGAVGLMIGGVITILRNAIKTARADCVTSTLEDDCLVIYISGQASYITAINVEIDGIGQIEKQDMINRMPSNVIIDCKDLTFIDVDGVAALEAIAKFCQKQGIVVSFVCLHDVDGKNLIQGSPFLNKNVPKELLDFGAYSRAQYNLQPIKDQMMQKALAKVGEEQLNGDDTPATRGDDFQKAV